MRARRRLGSTVAFVLAVSASSGAGHDTSAILTDNEAVAGSMSTATCFPPSDLVPPSVGASVIAKTTPYLPGYIRQGGTYYVYASVADGGCSPSGVASVSANVSTVTTGQTTVALASGSFSAGGVSYTHRSGSLTANAALTAGAKAYTITATDVAGNGTTQSGFSVTVDNTRPVGADVQTTNGGGTLGKPELGDGMTLTYSETLDPESVLSGWTGAATNVVVRITQNAGGDVLTVRNAANTAQLPMGSINLTGTAYVTTTRDFGASGTSSTMIQSGSTITITLGTASGTTGTQATTGVMAWTPTTTVTDRAGNTCMTTVATETGAADVDF